MLRLTAVWILNIRHVYFFADSHANWCRAWRKDGGWNSRSRMGPTQLPSRLRKHFISNYYLLKTNCKKSFNWHHHVDPTENHFQEKKEEIILTTGMRMFIFLSTLGKSSVWTVRQHLSQSMAMSRTIGWSSIKVRHYLIDRDQMPQWLCACLAIEWCCK